LDVTAQKVFCLKHSISVYLQSNLNVVIMLILQMKHLVPGFTGWKKPLTAIRYTESNQESDRVEYLNL